MSQTYRIELRRDPETIEITADDLREALVLAKNYQPGCCLLAIESADGAESEVVVGACQACGLALLLGDEKVCDDEGADYCLACARQANG